MRETLGHLILITVVSGAIFFTGLGQSRLWDRDEPRNAGCAAEMLERGDWVVPVFNDQLRQQKPILLYWLMMSAYSVLGVTEWAARFWSAALAIGTTLATYLIGTRLYDRRTGCLAAIALASSVMFAVAARAATPDSVLMFFGTSALAVFVMAAFPRADERGAADARRRFFPTGWPMTIAIYALLGMAVLAKGPVGFLLPMAMMGLYGLIVRRQNDLAEANADDAVGIPASASRGVWRRVRYVVQSVAGWFHPVRFFKTLWAMHPLTAAVVVLAVTAPWFVAVHIQTEGDFTRRFFIGEHVGRATVAMESHSGGWWYYPVAILFGFFPWSCFWIPTCLTLWSEWQESDDAAPAADRRQWRLRAHSLLLCWIGVQLVTFTIAKTKLPSYVTPCYPALALLTAYGLIQFVDAARQRVPVSAARRWLPVHPGWYQLGFLSLATTGLAILVGTWLVMGALLPPLRWLALLGLVPLAGGAVLTWQSALRRRDLLVPVLALTAVGFMTLVFGVGTIAVDRQNHADRVLDEIQRLQPARVGAYRCLESSWVYYGGQPIVELQVASDGTPVVPVSSLASVQSVGFEQPVAPSATAISRPVRKFWKPVPWEPVPQFARQPDVVILTTGEHVDELLAQLPEDFEVLSRTSLLLESDTLCLVGSRRLPAVNQNRPAVPDSQRLSKTGG